MTVVYLAHAGHWLTSVITMAPVVALALWLIFITVRDRRRERDEDGSGADSPS